MVPGPRGRACRARCAYRSHSRSPRWDWAYHSPCTLMPISARRRSLTGRGRSVEGIGHARMRPGLRRATRKGCHTGVGRSKSGWVSKSQITSRSRFAAAPRKPRSRRVAPHSPCATTTKAGPTKSLVRPRRTDCGCPRSAPGHLMILVTEPAPTVRPPSRIAKRRPSSMAIGWISFTLMKVLSPGMTISVPSASVTTPVTSVVRK